MYKVEQGGVSETFKRAWQAAGRHIQKQGQGGVSWIRSDLNPPMAEHLSFRVGNQLFFIYVEAAEFTFDAGKELFLSVSKEAGAIPCIIPMIEGLSDFEPEYAGWGLLSAITKELVNPLDMVTDENIEMTDWELHDFAIQVVKSHLEKEGKNITSTQSSLHIDPNLWFEEEGFYYWIVVRAVRYPNEIAEPPQNIEAIKRNCLPGAEGGYFASVVIANADDPFDPIASVNGNYLPVYRGHGLMPKFGGLVSL